jgi:hypothetical protein
MIAVPIALVLGGCSQTSRPGPGGTTTPVAGYNFEVRGAGGAHTRGQAATFSIQAGANSAEVKDGKLTVNGKSYGVVADGATILAEETGKVTLNGQERRPE